jgi:hypothetical protein
MRYGRILASVAVRAVCCEVMSLLVMHLKVGTIGVSFWHQ